MIITRLGLFVLFCSIGVNILGCFSNAVVIAPATPLVTPATPTRFLKPTGKLSFRLETLANSPGLRAASIEEQARALSLPATGAGSLIRDAQGRVLVQIRVADVSEVQQQILRDAGANIINVSTQFKIVTAFATISNLRAIANLGVVQSVQEELTPGFGGDIFKATPP